MKFRSTVAWLCPTFCLLMLAPNAGAKSGDQKGSVSFAGPDFKTVLSLADPGDPKISPDGTAVLFTVRKADWEGNRFDTEIWLVHEDEEPFQLTRTKENSSSNASWSPDGTQVAFLADLLGLLVGEHDARVRHTTAVPGPFSGVLDYATVKISAQWSDRLLMKLSRCCPDGR